MIYGGKGFQEGKFTGEFVQTSFFNKNCFSHIKQIDVYYEI